MDSVGFYVHHEFKSSLLGTNSLYQWISPWDLRSLHKLKGEAIYVVV
jgi:hypothetical protein